YNMADEWVQLAKKYWTEKVIDHHGKFFEANEATMGPKPSVLPPLVNAGASPRGLKFAAENCNIAFVMASDNEKSFQTGRQVKQIAREVGNPDLKTYGLITVIPGDTDEEAQARMDHFNAGIDKEALADIAAGYEQNKSYKELSDSSKSLIGGDKQQSSVMPGELVGSYETLARRLATTVIESELDGIMLVVPDYIEDLAAVAQKTLPLMAKYGVECHIGTNTPTTV
ncbi:LLM class flavin-dependent oxidoreductase, partial [Paenarthrobacter sp. NPDC058040]|uniref:LLM class flavin-dependent oxidoreductase n=1 Tax=Paenarthrobacter sp. NPDC058040 TaxID=3346309 RepID=UPI0036DF6D8C